MTRKLGIQAIWRQVLKMAFIFEGQPLMAQFRLECPKCNFLDKKNLKVSTGQLDNSLCPALAIYNFQINLFGPFSTFSWAKKRATIKVCCPLLLQYWAVDLKVIDGYYTIIRFGFHSGFLQSPISIWSGQELTTCMGRSDVKSVM